MKPLAPIIAIFALSPLFAAPDLGRLIFQDDFSRTESQEKTDEPGNGWGTNSKSRAKGDKQVDLKDGAMRMYISPNANHAISVTHPVEFTNGAVSLRFGEDGAYAGFDERSPLATASGKRRIVESLALEPPALGVGDGSTDLAMRPAVAAFAAFTGFVRREPVAAAADHVLSSFTSLRELVLA